MLKYCAWCGSYQGTTEGEGYQIRSNICEIDTATICPPCLGRVVQEHNKQHQEHNEQR